MRNAERGADRVSRAYYCPTTAHDKSRAKGSHAPV